MGPSILMLNYEFPPLGGGSGNATRYLLREFAKHPSLQVDLVTSALGDRLQVERFSDRIRLYRLPVGKKQPHFWTMIEIARWTWRARWFSRRLVRRRDYDLSHCWSGWPSGIIGFLQRRRLPYIVGLRGSDVPGYNVRLHALDRLLFRHVSPVLWRGAAAVTAVSRHLKTLAEQTTRRVEIQVVHNGVDVEEFTPGIPPGQFTILYVGRLIERKGLIYLLQAFRDLCDESDEAQLIIVGEGPDRLALQDYCHRSRIESRVSFLGVVDHKELPAIYRRASIFVMPALEEAMSNAMLEAMACGLPALITDTGATELVEDCGRVVERRSSEQLRDAIRRYYVDRELLDRHRLSARRMAERMTWKEVARVHLEIYRRCLELPDRHPQSAA